MADLFKWCLDNVEYQLVLKGIRHYRVQKYFILTERHFDKKASIYWANNIVMN